MIKYFEHNIVSSYSMDMSPTNVPANASANGSTLMEPGITIVQDSHSVQLTTFAPSNSIITEDLTQSVTIVKDSSEDESLVEQIKACAAQIQCSDFHGKGSVEDYSALFDAASKIVSDVKQVQLDIDIHGVYRLWECGGRTQSFV